MEETIRFYAENEMDTIPLICIEHETQLKKPRMKVGMEIGEYVFIALMAITSASELWFAKDYYGERCVIKIVDKCNNIELIQKIRAIQCDNLVPILDCGTIDSYWYEVYPYYKNGHLKEQLEEDKIKQIVLPAIICALEYLHGAGIIHNDIKPQNIFWNDEKTQIVLGDYGCVSEMKTRPNGYTPAYAAPELLLNDVSRRASDWTSVGLLLAKLINGELLVNAKSSTEALRIWEKGIFFSNASLSFQRLVNGMITIDPKKRLGPNAAKKWCGDGTFGGEERVSVHKSVGQMPITLSFENPSWIAVDIVGLFQGIESHWDYAVFLFQQAKIDKFLLQFHQKWGNICKSHRRLFHPEDALFRLTLDLTEDAMFIWRGKRYSNLLEMERTWEQDKQGELNVISFLQKGHVRYYLEKHQAELEQIKFAERLQDISRVYPIEACSQLFQALRGNNAMEWEDTVFYDLNDVVVWLEKHIHCLDEKVEKMFQSKRFEAWLTYQGMENVLDEIRRKCEV